jgi:hypothetical protein
MQAQRTTQDEQVVVRFFAAVSSTNSARKTQRAHNPQMRSGRPSMALKLRAWRRGPFRTR